MEATPVKETINHKRYCPSCGIYRPAEFGQMTGFLKRQWRCQRCLDKAAARRAQRLKESNHERV